MKLKKKYITLVKEQRLYNCSGPIIGLTGGIASGKSTVSKLLNEQGLHIICADKLIKQIYELPSTIDFIRSNYRENIQNDKINFKQLRTFLFNNPIELKNMEQFLHPQIKTFFLKETNNQTSSVIVYDIPLLFEKKLQDKMDYIICVYASQKIQLARILKRDNTTPKTAQKIITSQIDLKTKADLSNYVIQNINSLQELEAEVQHLINNLFEKN